MVSSFFGGAAGGLAAGVLAGAAFAGAGVMAVLTFLASSAVGFLFTSAAGFGARVFYNKKYHQST